MGTGPSQPEGVVTTGVGEELGAAGVGGEGVIGVGARGEGVEVLSVVLPSTVEATARFAKSKKKKEGRV